MEIVATGNGNAKRPAKKRMRQAAIEPLGFGDRVKVCMNCRHKSLKNGCANQPRNQYCLQFHTRGHHGRPRGRKCNKKKRRRIEYPYHEFQGIPKACPNPVCGVENNVSFLYYYRKTTQPRFVCHSCEGQFQLYFAKKHRRSTRSTAPAEQADSSHSNPMEDVCAVADDESFAIDLESQGDYSWKLERERLHPDDPSPANSSSNDAAAQLLLDFNNVQQKADTAADDDAENHFATALKNYSTQDSGATQDFKYIVQNAVLCTAVDVDYDVQRRMLDYSNFLSRSIRGADSDSVPQDVENLNRSEEFLVSDYLQGFDCDAELPHWSPDDSLDPGWDCYKLLTELLDNEAGR